MRHQLAAFLLLFPSLACTQFPTTSGPTSSSTSGGSSSSGGIGEVQLAMPPAGEGFQYSTGSFEVAAGQEVQDCYFVQIPGTETDEVFVHKVELAMNEGSHHMNVFRVKTVQRNPDGTSKLGPENGPVVRGLNGMGECFKSPNWADWPLIINSQQGGHLDWTLPDGVAHKFHGGEWLMIQTHYVNATTQMTPIGGSVKVNFWTVGRDDVTAELGTIFATKQSIRICESSPTPTFSGTCQLRSSRAITIVGANGHFHSRGKKFEMFAWDGTSTTTPPAEDRFYSSESWDDPPMLRSPDLTRSVPLNGGVWYTCGFEWQEPPASVGCTGLNDADRAKGTAEENLDCCYTFGGIVEKSEHCNAFIYYYPKSDDVNCF